MTLIILGSNGMLGSMLYFVAKVLYKRNDIIKIERNEFDVLQDNISKLDNIIGNNNTNLVLVNCVGAIPQKSYTDKEYYLINTQFPHILVDYCKNKNIKLVHISTNCVFSNKQSNCCENDLPNADDIYGKTKYEGEPSYGLVIRCSIIGPELKSFSGLMEWFLYNNSNEVYGFIDSYWNGLTTLELSKIILEEINYKTNSNKLIHYYSENTISKYDILLYIKNKFNKDINIIKKDNGIKNYTLFSNYTTPRKNIYKQIDELFDIYNKYKQFYNLK